MNEEEFIEKVENVTNRLYGFKGYKEFPGWDNVKGEAIRISTGCRSRTVDIENKLTQFRRDIEHDIHQAGDFPSSIEDVEGIYFDIGKSIEKGINEGGFYIKIWVKEADQEEDN